MIPVDEAVERIASAFTVTAAERVAVAHAAGRVLADDVIAQMDQPPEPVSSMDGYAVRSAEATSDGAVLRVVGTAPAGRPFRGTVNAGEAVRIFTGGVVPEGADSIVIQEDADSDGDIVTLRAPAVPHRHIRAAGLDFAKGEVLLSKDRRLTARDLALAAAGDNAEVTVRRRPRVAFVATGDELSHPGAPRMAGGIVASSGYGLSAMIAEWGGEAFDLGIVPDTVEAVASIADRAAGTDLLITLGGASVGDHDLVQKALGPRGFALDFWKIAMRPGKPLVFGRLGDTPLLGLPGNPVSTLVCALLFVKPAIAAMLGTDGSSQTVRAMLKLPLKANDTRQDYVRARLELRGGVRVTEPFAVQDSSMLSTFARADCLIVRAPHAAAAAAGESVDVILL